MKPIWKNPFRKLYTINDLSLKTFTLKQQSKGSVKILIVDDNDFEYKNEMMNFDFNLKTVDDIAQLDFVSNYDIIICDIRGVGKKLGYKFEGVGLINDLKKKYPYKLYGVYTGNDVSLEMSAMLDGVKILPKNLDKEDWKGILDQLVKEVLDPQTLWMKMRSYLLNEGVSLYDVVLLEHEYVYCMKHKGGDVSSLFDDIDSTIPVDMKSFFISFSSNIATHIIFGA